MQILPESTLTKRQLKLYQRVYKNDDGEREIIIVEFRFDDKCNNGHNTFTATAKIYTAYKVDGEGTITVDGKTYWLESFGQQHEKIAKHFLLLKPYLKWHLCSTDGPLYYIDNTMYWVEKDNLGYARSCSIWPEAQLTDFTVDNLNRRLIGLMIDFKAAMEDLGFTY